MTLERAARNLKAAVEFFDRVEASTETEKLAVGTDHWDWLELAARTVASLAPAKEPDEE